MTSEDRPTKPGILYVVGVPIGHLDDITLRATRTLRNADLIASEDPAATRLLLSHHDIDTALTSYGPTNLKEKVAVLIERLQRGARIALVSDCGSPVLADPGCLLVASAHDRGIRVISVPGPSALTAAVAAAGLSCDSFFFQGRLPETKDGMRRCLARCLKSQVPTVAFCTARSLTHVLKTIAGMAPRRFIVVACDLTRREELIVRGTARQVQEQLEYIAAGQDVTIMLSAGGKIGNRRPGMKSKRKDRLSR